MTFTTADFARSRSWMLSPPPTRWLRRVHILHLSHRMPLSRLLDTAPPQVLPESAHGCLEPPPTRRLRRVHILHLSHSMTLSRLLDTAPPRLLTEAAHGSLKPPPTRR